ncbi:hypothetical protein QYE80_13205 [Pseudomonas tohonis]|uniref:hypothetical protein n=1 Tax=Pseudomonas sp. zfem005 TaxID=3078200 RepID=UPI000395EBEB|nr:hypothetical protein [Pseudomonas sp. zfem005]EQM72057.1 hypothetical protein L682_00120 [Pseudomonas alcaligenes OT 69]MDN4145947.1 hypothetical protein [Pseudomonas tohonis]MDU9415280.1 hypothetical protein [Pseudomonas sp. zfem005]
MKLIKIILASALLIGAAAPAYSEDGYDRSYQMNQKFREDQKRLWGDKDKSDAQKTERSLSREKDGQINKP